MLQQILLCKVPLTPELFLLSMILDNIDKAMYNLYIITAARILYAKNGRSQVVLKQEDLTETAEMDILSEVMKAYPLQKATKRWDLFHKWLESSDSAQIT